MNCAHSMGTEESKRVSEQERERNSAKTMKSFNMWCVHCAGTVTYFATKMNNILMKKCGRFLVLFDSFSSFFLLYLVRHKMDAHCSNWWKSQAYTFTIFAQKNPNELMCAEKVDRCFGGVKSKCALLKDAHKQAPAHIRWTKRQHSIAK